MSQLVEEKLHLKIGLKYKYNSLPKSKTKIDQRFIFLECKN